MSDRVSILTPCFGHEKFLVEYFESLLAQTHREVELIFFDDGSTDGSWGIAQSYRERLQSRFDRVVLRRNERNLGLLATLARMRSEIRGEILCILESDDFLYPTKIEENVAYLRRHPEVGLVHSDADFLYSDAGRIEGRRWGSRGRKIPVGEVFDDLLDENFILTCTMACRASLVTDHVDFRSYRDRGYRTADYPMFLDLARRAPFGYIDRPLAVYRVVEGSISHARSEVGRLEWKLGYYGIKQEYIRRYGCREETRKRAETQLHLCLMQLGWASGSVEKFGRGYSWLLKEDPHKARRWPQRARNVAIRNSVLWRTARRLETLMMRSSAARTDGDPGMAL